MILLVDARGQSQGIAYVDSIYHICGEELGFVKIGLNGSPSEYEYFWNDGSSELRRTNLNPGKYRFTIRDEAGCVETLNIKIIEFNSPEVDIYQSNLNPCEAELGLVISEVWSSQNEIIQPEGLDIQWVASASSPSYQNKGNYIIVDRTQTGTYYVTVKLSKNNYCTVDDDHTVNPSSSNEMCNSTVIGNKLSEGNRQDRENKNNIVFIYPNPVNDILNIEYRGNGDGIYSIELRSISGEIQASKMPLNSERIRLILKDELKSGIYFIKIHLFDGQIVNKKIVIVD